MKETLVEEMGAVGRVLMVSAAVIVVLAGIKAASVILVPLFLAIFIAVIVQPVLTFFQKRGLPSLVGIGVIFLGISVIGFFLTMLIVESVNEFSASFPGYRLKFSEHFDWIVATLARFNIQVDVEILQNQLDPSRIMTLLMNMLSGIGGMMTNTILVVLIVVFILGEAANIPQKIAVAFDKTEDRLESLSKLLQSINKYLALKTLISLLTGLVIGIALWLMQIEHFMLWAVLAFLLNYIPNIGSILAAVPAIFMALIQYHVGMAGGVAAVYIAVNMVMGNVIEPRVMGQQLGLSTLVVFLSLIFWGWLLGAVGMLLSVPLTMMVKIALQQNKETRWLAILLGADAEIQMLLDKQDK